MLKMTSFSKWLKISKRERAVSTEASFCAKIVISSAKHAALSSAAVPGMETPRKRRDCEMLRMKDSMAILKSSGERPQPCRTLRVILKQGSQTHVSMWAAVESSSQSAGRTTKRDCFFIKFYEHYCHCS
jgi:hypothetical protein